MYNPLRNRFGIPGVISVAALVFAMLGGAYAATGNPLASNSAKRHHKKAKHRKGKASGLNAMQKKEVKKIAKSVQGAGPQGAKGDAGPAGSAGNDGAQGATGDAGATGPAGSAGPKGDTGATGPDGSPWTDGGVLPSESTETGVWIADGEITHPFLFQRTAAVSFPIALEDPIDEEHVRYVNPAGEEEDPVAEEFVTPVHCLGSAESPSASSGYFCIYGAILGGAVLGVKSELPYQEGAQGAGTSGTLILLIGLEESSALSGRGAWAVTAP